MISVIVPIYNAQEHLRQCVESIIMQLYLDIEIVLVDDGSTDGSWAICQEYAALDGRIRLVQQPNGGLSAARNAGIAVAEGDLLAFVDADDVLHPECLRLLADDMARTGCDIAGCDFVYSQECMFPTVSSAEPLVFEPREAIRLTLYQHRLNNAAWGKLYRRKLFDGLRFADGLWYEDLEIFYKLYERANRVCFDPRRLYFYRANPHGFLGRFKPERLDVLTVTDQIAEHYAGDPVLGPAARDRKFSACCNMFLLSSLNGHEAPGTWLGIKALRREVLCNRHSRLKNRVGALLSYFGRKPLIALGKIIYK